MRWSYAGGVASLIVLTGVVVTMGVPPPPEPAPTVPAGWRFKLPEGDARAGEAVFRKLECSSCHRVAGHSFAPAGAEAKQIGPLLTAAHAALPPEYIAHRLISYDRFLAEGLYKATWSRSDGSSRMGNFNEAMSVRDLTDLVAFIRSIEEP